MPRTSAKAGRFTESVIRDMTRLALRHGAVNLAQGFPDFACPPELKAAAIEAIEGDVNQYAITWGAPGLPGRHRRQDEPLVPRLDGRSGDRGDGHLRGDRGHDRGHAGAAGPGRRGGGLRAVLRELRPRRDPVRRHGALRDAARARLDDRRGGAAGGLRPADAGHRRQRRPTTRPARCSAGPSWSSSPSSAASTTRSPSRTRSTSTWSTRASTSRWPPCPAWPSERWPSTRSPRPTRSPAGGWAGSSPRRPSAPPSARSTTS